MNRRRLMREPQGKSGFVAADPAAGYYNDLSGVARSYGEAHLALGWLEMFARRRQFVLPVTMLQLGLGAWQLAQQGDDARWQDVARAAAEWTVLDLDGTGRMLHHQAMPHTYELAAGWSSAMAQGQAASLLVRAALTLQRPELLDDAERALAPLLEPGSALVVQTSEGPVLQEYPTTPPSHVLNGWVWALWGLYDVAQARAQTPVGAAARAAFEHGVDALVARLPLYEVAGGWSRYDLYPHPISHVASPFYHRLHVQQLRALHELAPRAQLAATADRWEAALSRRLVVAGAVARKVGFRLLRPRGRAA